MGQFSRLLSLNTWLSSVCVSHSVAFIDNFNVFWDRRHLFEADGLHLNRTGSCLLSTSISYGLQHAHSTSPFDCNSPPDQSPVIDVLQVLVTIALVPQFHSFHCHDTPPQCIELRPVDLPSNSTVPVIIINRHETTQYIIK